MKNTNVIRHRPAGILAGLMMLFPLLATAQVAADDFAITGVNVIPMDGEHVLENQTVVVVDGVIRSLGNAQAVTVPDDLLMIDGTGRYLAPGMADLHTHILHADDLVNYLRWGVTTVMHLGGTGVPGTELLKLREEIHAGDRIGPHIYTTNRVFDGVPPLNSRSLSIDTADMAHDEVRRLKAGGFDFIKIYNNVSRPVFEAIVDEARRQGLSVIGHIPRGFPAIEALTGGQNAVAHTEEFFFTYFGGPRKTEGMRRDYVADLGRLPALIDVMLENDIATMPDLAFTFTDLLMWDDLDILWNDPEYPYLHPAAQAMWQSGTINRRSALQNFVLREEWKYDLMQTLTLEFHKAGVLQVIGTDTALPGLFPGKAAHRELTELVKAGLSLYDALAVGTRNAGEFVRRYIDADARFGIIRPGYAASLVLLDDNPLQDIRNMRRVSAVAVDGRWIEREEVERLRAAMRTRYESIREASARVQAVLGDAAAEELIRDIIGEQGGNPELASVIESTINAAGYRAATGGNLDEGQRLLSLNTHLFPDSANTWDSLAELTLYLGDRDAAIELYRKALEADPGFENARRKIAELQQ
jgi:tetratricopeptide (TPR) repeat protein